MKPSSLFLPTSTVALLSVAIFAAASVAQAPQASPPGADGRPPRSFPAPTNLKVLPKDLNGQQVRDIMRGWAGGLGVHCDYCHAADPNKVGPNGRPELDFALDTKPDKEMARIMYTMTEDIKKNYVAKVVAMDKMDEPAPPVTCGTCHRGHEDPEAFIPPPEHHGPPPAGGMPSMQKPD
ncbi:MAG: c-type cytochrome [Terracidiphilus sp.]